MFTLFRPCLEQQRLDLYKVWMSLLEARSCCSSQPILQKALQGRKPPYNSGLLPVVKALSDRTQFLQADVLKLCIQLLFSYYSSIAEDLYHIFSTEIQKMSKYWTASKTTLHISDTTNRAYCEYSIYTHINKASNSSLFP